VYSSTTRAPEGCQKFPHVVRGNGSIASRMGTDRPRPLLPHRLQLAEAFKEEMNFKR
jgi:hypothetical protein